MRTEETKNNETKGGCTDFGCCNPEDFKKMFEKKCKCFSDPNDVTDFFAMKEGMMKKMMEMCFGSKAEDTERNTEPQKEPK